MGWIITPKPGDDALCAKPCKHIDCAQYRKEAKWHCHLCEKPLGHGAKIIRYGDNGCGPHDPPLVHYLCAEKDANAHRANRNALDTFFGGGP
jgi:hypothetical protein